MNKKTGHAPGALAAFVGQAGKEKDRPLLPQDLRNSENPRPLAPTPKGESQTRPLRDGRWQARKRAFRPNAPALKGAP